jgi:hypothetical protein
MYGYAIVRKGGHQGAAFDRGTLGDIDLATAQRLAQTITSPAVAGKSGLEVIVLDDNHAEVWRGPYIGRR